MWQKDGFAPADAKLEDALEQLEHYIREVPAIMRSFTEEERLRKPAPGKWSRQEILGHLVDSALNNLRRFTEIQFSQAHPFVISPYRQDDLVVVNCYQQQPIQEVLTLWESLNRQIVWVSRHIPPEKLELPVDPSYDNKQLRTLEWPIADYVSHLQHHLKQALLK